MDAGVITATTGFVGAIVALLGALGGGLAFLIRRADKKRETGEALMLEHLKAELRKAHRALAIRTRDGNAWRDQLLRNDIEPEPAEWSPLPDERDDQ